MGDGPSKTAYLDTGLAKVTSLPLVPRPLRLTISVSLAFLYTEVIAGAPFTLVGARLRSLLLSHR